MHTFYFHLFYFVFPIQLLACLSNYHFYRPPALHAISDRRFPSVHRSKLTFVPIFPSINFSALSIWEPVKAKKFLEKADVIIPTTKK